MSDQQIALKESADILLIVTPGIRAGDYRNAGR